MAENLVDFAIITAIEVERQAICKALRITNKHKVSKDARVYWKKLLQLKGKEFYEIVVTQLHDTASIDAVRAVDDLIRDYQPGALLMVGIAASANEDVTLGDIVLGREVCYYERGKVVMGGKLPEPKQHAADETLWSRVITLPKWESPISIGRPDGTNARPQIKYGVIASGEKVIANADIRDEIAASNRKIIAIEMEGYGVSAAAYKQHQPVRCLVIRAISDFGNASKNDQWQLYAAAVAAEFTKHFLRDKPLNPRNKRITLPPTSLDVDYKVVTEAIIQGHLIPFLGEGINSCDRAANDCEWQPGLYPPSDSDLADYLAKKYEIVTSSPVECPNLEQLKREHQSEKLSTNQAFTCPLFGNQKLVRERKELPYLSEHIDLKLGSLGLYTVLHQIFDQDYQPNQLHRFIALLPRVMGDKGYPLPYKLIVTTNYDDTLELAFKQTGQPFDLVSYIAKKDDEYRGKFVHHPYAGKPKIIEKPNEYNEFPLGIHPVILKLYGAVDRERGQEDNFVITEDHYMDYLGKTEIPTILIDLLRKNHILFLGYDLSKWKQRLIFRRIWQDKPLDQCKSWAVDEIVDELEQKLWNKNYVDIINSSLGTYISQLNQQIETIPKKV